MLKCVKIIIKVNASINIQIWLNSYLSQIQITTKYYITPLILAKFVQIPTKQTRSYVYSLTQRAHYAYKSLQSTFTHENANTQCTAWHKTYHIWPKTGNGSPDFINKCLTWSPEMKKRNRNPNNAYHHNSWCNHTQELHSVYFYILN